MPFHRRQCLGGLAVAAAFVLAGCNSGTAPQTQLPDPQGLSNDLATVAGVLETRRDDRLRHRLLEGAVALR